MKHDKRRNEPPEDRRNFEDRQAKREERRETLTWRYKEPTKEEVRETMAHEMRKMASAIDELGRVASKTAVSMRGSFVIIDEFDLPAELPKRVQPYVADRTWGGWLPEPEGLRGKQKKRWHATQYKAYKQWNAEADLREAVELELVGESRADLGWGGF